MLDSPEQPSPQEGAQPEVERHQLEEVVLRGNMAALCRELGHDDKAEQYEQSAKQLSDAYAEATELTSDDSSD